METYINNIINKKYNTDRGYLYFIDLLLEKYPDFQINYDNLNKLEISSITKSVFLESGFSGVYTFQDNKIRIFNNIDENGKEIFKDITISDDELINTFLHELIHAITSKENFNNLDNITLNKIKNSYNNTISQIKQSDIIKVMDSPFK